MILQKGYSRDHSIGTHVVLAKVVITNRVVEFSITKITVLSEK
jgi:hypothetical protein